MESLGSMDSAGLVVCLVASMVSRSRSSCIGQWDPSEGTFTGFAKPSDSGSFVLRVSGDLSEPLESEAIVTRTEGVGLLYGIVWEEKY